MTPSPARSADDSLRTLGSWLAVGAGLLGGALLCVGASLSSPRGAALVQSGSSVLIAAMALFGILVGIRTWGAARREAREEETRRIYSDLTVQLMSRFAGSYDRIQDATLRAQVSAWASPEVVQSLSEWNRTLSELTLEPIGKDSFRVKGDGPKKLQAATSKVVAAIRADLGSAVVEPSQIEGALFNPDELPPAP